jgi:hypothetical protein
MFDYMSNRELSDAEDALLDVLDEPHTPEVYATLEGILLDVMQEVNERLFIGRKPELVSGPRWKKARIEAGWTEE